MKNLFESVFDKWYKQSIATYVVVVILLPIWFPVMIVLLSLHIGWTFAQKFAQELGL